MKHKKVVEGAMLRYFTSMTVEARCKLFKKLGVDYGAFMSVLRRAWEDEKALPNEVQLAHRLRTVRAFTKPRLGALGRRFTLRHWPEARRLRDQGASYKEIAEYLRLYRRFKISPVYLRRLMENLT